MNVICQEDSTETVHILRVRTQEPRMFGEKGSFGPEVLGPQDDEGEARVWGLLALLHPTLTRSLQPGTP